MRPFATPAAILATTVLLAACSSPTQEAQADSPFISVVASTNVYGDIAEQLGGEFVEVTSIIEDASQDPHSYEADARVQLALSKADIIVENGGGYDFYIQALLSGAGNEEVELLNASRISGLGERTEEFNEHVWFNVPTIQRVARELTKSYIELDRAHEAEFRALGEALDASLQALITKTGALKKDFRGTAVAVTEPLPDYLLEDAGLRNVTPDEFTEAIEEGSEVSATLLRDTVELLSGGEAKLLIYNEQTAGAETRKLVAAAETAAIGVIPITEILPPDVHYVTWMGGILDSLRAGLDQANG